MYAGGPAPAVPGNLAYVEQNFGPVADFGKRALAYLIDLALLLIGVIPLIVGTVLAVVAAGDLEGYDQFGSPVYGDANEGLLATGGLVGLLGALLSLGIAIWNRWVRAGRTGQSVGKSVIGLMLVDTTTGRPVGVGKAFLRDIVHSLVNQVIYLSFLWMLWDADRQTVGDKAVSSTVIVVPKKTS
ncbi:MAG: RDD family protein [Dermatophilaceae bacterium]